MARLSGIYTISTGRGGVA